ncbi:hypothetical protein GUJ93_ZPchr0010g9508 [Zizania palustris]|uniref:Uncharacterized protein n=1 Tax=Zizania palustris TaxID=103762 RepID=A0A8J6BEU4_ZIZPA|nr:hypothetical protein GUJ93_ZPchr0010g9508 [Zizania palustris]
MADAPSYLPPLVDSMVGSMGCAMDCVEEVDDVAGHCQAAAAAAAGATANGGTAGCGFYGDHHQKQQQQQQLGHHDHWDDDEAQHLLIWDQEILTPSNLEAMQQSGAHSLLFMGPNDHD